MWKNTINFPNRLQTTITGSLGQIAKLCLQNFLDVQQGQGQFDFREHDLPKSGCWGRKGSLLGPIRWDSFVDGTCNMLFLPDMMGWKDVIEERQSLK